MELAGNNLDELVSFFQRARAKPAALHFKQFKIS